MLQFEKGRNKNVQVMYTSGLCVGRYDSLKGDYSPREAWANNFNANGPFQRLCIHTYTY